MVRSRLSPVFADVEIVSDDPDVQTAYAAYTAIEVGSGVLTAQEVFGTEYSESNANDTGVKCKLKRKNSIKESDFIRKEIT